MDYLLSTVDNPFNPHTQWDEWYAWDTAAGHNSLSLLARVAKTSDALSDADQELAYDQAVDEIVRLNVSGVHKKVASTS